MEALIEASGLTKLFDKLTAVEDVTLRVEQGQILALLGPNGAGKTTTIRMLASILPPTRGRARIAGYDVLEQAHHVRESVGLLTEHHGLYTRMRPKAYLAFFGRTYGLTQPEAEARAVDLLERFGLTEDADRRLGHYSRGMRQKLALARAMLHDPPVLLLDEPTSAMDPASARMVRQSIQALRSSNRAIIVCTHNLAEAESLADRIAIIRKGRIVALGSPKALKQELLGDPIMELTLAGRLDGAVQALPQGIEPLECGDTWLRYRTPAPERANPRVLEAMSRAGLSVVTLAEVGRSLEDVYLRVVADPDPVESPGL
jgi:ABC-2 type transport system ATP-binding protein